MTEKSSNKRRYPPLYEIIIPIALFIVAITILILLIIIAFVGIGILKGEI